jgi:hypothetical protein
MYRHRDARTQFLLSNSLLLGEFQGARLRISLSSCGFRARTSLAETAAWTTDPTTRRAPFALLHVSEHATMKLQNTLGRKASHQAPSSSAAVSTHASPVATQFGNMRCSIIGSPGFLGLQVPRVGQAVPRQCPVQTRQVREQQSHPLLTF